jgi:hypothetical protein
MPAEEGSNEEEALNDLLRVIEPALTELRGAVALPSGAEVESDPDPDQIARAAPLPAASPGPVLAPGVRQPRLCLSPSASAAIRSHVRRGERKSRAGSRAAAPPRSRLRVRRGRPPRRRRQCAALATASRHSTISIGIWTQLLHRCQQEYLSRAGCAPALRGRRDARAGFGIHACA